MNSFIQKIRIENLLGEGLIPGAGDMVEKKGKNRYFSLLLKLIFQWEEIDDKQ